MKALQACNLMKRHGFVHPHLSLKTFKRLRIWYGIEGPRCWNRLCQHILMLNYIAGTFPAGDQMVFIPEIPAFYGGTQTHYSDGSLADDWMMMKMKRMGANP